MYVACPSCKALYPVSADYLRLAAGRVRCSACQTLFDASSAVFDDPQQALDYEYPLQPSLMGEIDELVNRALDGDGEAAPEAETRAEIEVEQAVDDEPVDLPTIAASDAPHAAADHYAWPVSSEFCQSESIELASPEPTGRADLPHEYLLEDPESAPDQTAWGAIAAALLLTAGLIAQYAYVERYQLTQVTALRPAIELLCKSLDCKLPLRRDLAQMRMIERKVRQHPNADDALLIHAAFVNRADFVQAYPVLQISFADVSGTPIAARRFKPEEYLPAYAGILANGMPPGEEAMVMLEVVDPGNRAVSFQFDFM